MISEVRAAIDQFEAMIDYYAEHEPDRITRPGFQRLVLAMADLEAALEREVADADARLSDPSANTEGKVGATHPDTSRRAAQDAWPRTGTQRMRVLEAIRDARSRGLTHEELAEVTGINHYSAAPRCTELKDGGWVQDSGERRPTAQGGEAIVWVLTDTAARRFVG